MKLFTINDIVQSSTSPYVFSGTAPFDLNLLFLVVEGLGVEEIDVKINGESISNNGRIKPDTLLIPNNRIVLHEIKAGDNIEITIYGTLTVGKMISATFYGEEEC